MVNSILPLQAEAEELLWPTQLTMENLVPKIIIDGASKTFMVGISQVEDRSWRIKSCIEQNKFIKFYDYAFCRLVENTRNTCQVGYILPLHEQNQVSLRRQANLDHSYL